MSVIHVHGLCKTYRDGLLFGKRVEALRGATLEVQPGEIFGLLGPNGAGKTTLIKILLGIVRKTEGIATLFGLPAGNRQSRRRIGYLPEGHRLPGHLTGNTALEYYGGLSGLSPREVRRRSPALMERVGLAKWGKSSIRKYSKGMLQRLGLAQAMLHEPDVLILDEPTDGVDPVGRKEIREMLHEWKGKGKTIFLNSHLLHELEMVCDRVAILARGRVQRVGTVEEITTGNIGAVAQQIRFELVGDPERIKDALGPFKVTDSKFSGRSCTLNVMTQNQAELDLAIDNLRTREVSIVAITPKRQALEDVFMNVVSSTGE